MYSFGVSGFREKRKKGFRILGDREESEVEEASLVCGIWRRL